MSPYRTGAVLPMRVEVEREVDVTVHLKMHGGPVETCVVYGKVRVFPGREQEALRDAAERMGAAL